MLFKSNYNNPYTLVWNLNNNSINESIISKINQFKMVVSTVTLKILNHEINYSCTKKEEKIVEK